MAEQKITPCLWFNDNCEEAVNFYLSVFPDSAIESIMRYPDDMGGPMANMAGKVLTAMFELGGFKFQALDGGPMFRLNQSISFMVNFDPAFDDQGREHLDEMWSRLSEGGEVLVELGEYPFSKRYGWIKDRFGVSWQLILTNPQGEPRPFIIPALLFTGAVAGRTEEALNYYAQVFPDSRQPTLFRYPAGAAPEIEGSVMFGEAALSGEWVTAMDSARDHDFAFNEAISFSIECADQVEVDHYWEKLSAVPEAEACGWVKDQFGVSWQIVPKQLGEMMAGPDKQRSNQALAAMLKMKKLDIAELEAAYNSD